MSSLSGWFYPIKFVNGRCYSITVGEWISLYYPEYADNWKNYHGLGWVSLFVQLTYTEEI